MVLMVRFVLPTRVAGGMLGDLFWGAAHHQFAALIAAIGSEINDPVGTANHIQVVLDHQNRVALIDEPLHHIHQSVKPLQTQGAANV